MAKLTLSLACGGYDRTRALFDGRVQVEGCEIVPLAMSPEEAFHRAFRHEEFDITELSLSSQMVAVDQGKNAYIGIPVFPSRLFRHSSIYLRPDSGIAKPADLAGRIVGLPDYQMTAALWVRGILQHEYGVAPSAIRWRAGGLEDAGRMPMVALDLPAGVELRALDAADTLAAALAEGRIDALISARSPSSMAREPRIKRLFPDYRAVEAAYFSKTGIFPIMHLVGIRCRLLDQHPWLAVAVLKAFQQAKELCYAAMENVGSLYTTLPWPVDELEKTRALMGRDFWRYGAAENATEISAITQYAFEQGLTRRKLEAADLFAAATLSLAKV